MELYGPFPQLIPLNNWLRSGVNTGERFVTMFEDNVVNTVRRTRDSILLVVLILTIMYLLILNLYYTDQRYRVVVEREGQEGGCPPSVSKRKDVSALKINDPKRQDDEEVQELRQKVLMYERLNKLLEFNSWMSQHGSKTRQNILILSNQYCGSALLGELFNQNPQVFYLHEPLKSLDFYKENRPTDVYDAMVTQQLDGIFQCKFDELSYFTNFMSFQYSSLKSRLASRALSAPPLCPEFSSRPFYTIRMCTPLKPQTTSAICKLHQHTVVKSIQLSEVQKLSYLMDKDNSDYSLKVVHLVRDPRAIVYTHFLTNQSMAMSSSAENSTKHLKEYSQRLCRNMLSNIKYAITAPSWMQGKYTLLRYEDLGTNPHQIAELVHKFVGVPMVPQVRVWLDKVAYSSTDVNGHHESPSYNNQPMSSSSSGMVEEMVTKNLTDSVHNWRLQLHYQAVRIVETECYEVMNLLGYKIVEDEDELTTLHISLVD